MPFKEPEELLRDLQSEDPSRVTEALAGLAHSLDSFGWEISLPSLSLDVLAPLGAKPSRQVQENFFSLVTGYLEFDPPLTDEARVVLLVGLCLRYADPYIALQTALWLKGRGLPLVAQALNELARHGLKGPAAVRGAQLLFSSLLDGSAEVRRLTVAALRDLPESASYEQVRSYVRPQLEAGEQLT